MDSKKNNKPGSKNSLMEKTKNTNFYPNRMGRIIFLATEEVLGRNGINAVANLAGLSEFIDHYPPNNQHMDFPFEYISSLQASFEDFYGPHGGRGVALRTGRACFQHILREFGPLFGLTDIAFRLLPMGTRIKFGAGAFADIFNKYTDQRVRLEEKGKELFWHIEKCPLCWGRQTDAVSCQMAVGFLQESLYWLSGGKFFNVEEISCIAKGDLTCTIRIDKTPLS